MLRDLCPLCAPPSCRRLRRYAVDERDEFDTGTYFSGERRLRSCPVGIARGALDGNAEAQAVQRRDSAIVSTDSFPRAGSQRCRITMRRSRWNLWIKLHYRYSILRRVVLFLCLQLFFLVCPLLTHIRLTPCSHIPSTCLGDRNCRSS